MASAKPHLDRFYGRWRVRRDGRHAKGSGGDAYRDTFPEACHLAMLAAIHSGVWRA
jgi:hypothetical protein